MKGAATVAFVKWVLTDGQKLAAPLLYAPVPDKVARRALEAVERIR